MSTDLWNVPETTEGMALVLERLAERRAAGDEHEVCRGLLRLAHLVKWVGSDNEVPPFPRSKMLAIEAYEIAVRLQDLPLQARALRARIGIDPPEVLEALCTELDRLAEAMDDDYERALALETRGRVSPFLLVQDRPGLYAKALAGFQAAGDLHAQARCHFSMAIQMGSEEEKRQSALRAAELFEQAGDLGHAGKALQIAVMNGEAIEGIAAQEPLIRRALGLAQRAGKPSDQSLCYARLAAVEAARGEMEAALAYLELQREVKPDFGETPVETWEADLSFAKYLFRLTQQSGNKDAAYEAHKLVQRIRRKKPKPK